MKRNSFSRRTWILLGVLAVALVAAVGGYAYFSTTGTGSGTAAVGSSTAGTITVKGTATGDLFPGQSVPVTFTASNSASFSQKLSGIHLSGVTADDQHSSCVTTDFTMPDVVVTEAALAGSTVDQALSESGTLSMADTDVSQDGCQGATLTLSFTTS